MPEIENATPVSETPEVQGNAADTGAQTPTTPESAESGSKGEGAIDVDVSALTAEIDNLKKSMRAMSGERSDAKKKADAESERASGLEKQVEALLSKLSERGKEDPEGDYQDAGKIHPRLKGLNHDPSDKTVEIDGQWYPERVALAIAKQEEFEESQTRSSQEAQAAQEQQEIQKGYQALETGLSNDITALLTKLNPDITADKQTFAARTIRNEVLSKLEAAGVRITDPYNPPENFAGEAKKAITEAYNEFRAMFGSAWAAQLADNENARQVHPVKPEGQPGAQATKSFHQMNERERQEAAAKAVKSAEARRSR
jgi:FtsZ-binding cell division protein ZapB